MTKRATIVWAGSVGTLVLGVISGLVLTNQSAITRVSMIFSVAALLSSLFAIPLFLTGLRHFKVELQKTYIILCIGIGVFGLAQVQLPLINLYNIGFWVDSGAIALPYLIGVISIFWSMRSLTRLLDVKSIWRSGLVAFAATVLISAIVALLPHVKVAIDELSYHIALSLSIWNSVFITFATILAFKVRQQIGLSYADAMNWLFRALAILSFAGWHYTLVQVFFTINDWYYDYSIALIPFVVGGLTLVIAGFTFSSINNTDQKNDAALTPKAAVKKSSPTVLTPSQELEVIVYVANLASNPSDIDPILDEVRFITSRLQPGQAPSLEDQKVLDSVYTKLEDYLLHQDPLRVFTVDELHERIAKRFGFSNSVKTTLWLQNQQ